MCEEVKVVIRMRNGRPTLVYNPANVTVVVIFGNLDSNLTVPRIMELGPGSYDVDPAPGLQRGMSMRQYQHLTSGKKGE